MTSEEYLVSTENNDILTHTELESLCEWPTPAIANAIETFDMRSRAAGFTNSEIVCRFPELGIKAGYAVTAKMRASIPGEEDPQTVDRDLLIEAMLSQPGPKFLVIQDLDQPSVGSWWGEVNSTRHTALGGVGVITDGGIRDLDEMRGMGFLALSKHVLVSHGYMHLVEVGGAVEVGGMLVRPGDLIVADQHGAIQVPSSIAQDIPAAAAQIELKERKTIAFDTDPAYSPGDQIEGKYP